MDFFKAVFRDIEELCGEKIMLGTNTITTLNLIIWSLFIGFVLGIAVTIYNKYVLGAVVRGLMEHKAHTEEAALTAGELGCSNAFIRLALRPNSSFRRVIFMVGDTEYEKKKEDFSTARFYLPEKNIHRAEVLYGNTGASAVTILLSLLAFLVVVFISFTVIPDLIQMLTNFIASIQPASKIL